MKPRDRRRAGPGGCNKAPDKSKFIGLTGEGSTYSPERILEENPNRNRVGFSFRTSRRWYPAPLFKRDWKLPYLNQLGKFTGHSIYEWTAFSPSVVSSITSSIATRLDRYCRKHNPRRFVDKNLKRIVAVSYLYACTRNDYLWDRVLFFCRNLQEKGPLLHRLFLKFLCKTSDSIRFVYSQVCSQTHWLLFRAERPRDKLVGWRGEKGSISNDRWPSVLARAVHIEYVAQAMASLCPPRFND